MLIIGGCLIDGTSFLLLFSLNQNGQAGKAEFWKTMPYDKHWTWLINGLNFLPNPIACRQTIYSI